MIQGLDHAALAVSDLPRAVSFYRDMLGLRPVDARDPATSSYWLNFGPGQTLNLALAPERTPNALGLAADLNTMAELERRLVKRGIKPHRSRTGVYFCDPDGNFLEVTCWREKGLEEAGAEHW